MTRCENCGAVADGYAELCPQCGAFASLLPVELPATDAPPTLAVHASEIDDGDRGFVSTGFEPWDEVLGGGLVLGSTLVVYGDPGSRKTTWMGAIADSVARKKRGRALYLSPEMPRDMVRDTISRIAIPKALFIAGSEGNVSNLAASLAEVVRLRPRVVVYDSIQNFDAGGPAGSYFAVKETVTQIRRFAAQYRHAAILISQVNRAGMPSGPYRTIHDCDIVAHLSFDKVSIKNKNRYAPTPREAGLP